ncbi:MAG: low molecular weight protein arginine phosphatase [Victivallales bacterium]
MNLLFVCTGNTCRSPMCEGYLKSLCAKADRTDLSVSSAGLFAGGGQPASANAVQTMRKYGIDLSGFRNRQLTKQMIADAGLIVAMTRSHRIRIGGIEPQALKKTRLLLEYADRPGADVADPFGGSVDVYGDCFSEMKSALDNLFLDLIGKHST